MLYDSAIETLRSATSLGTSLRYVGQYARARALTEETYPRYQEDIDGDTPDAYACRLNLAADLAATGAVRTPEQAHARCLAALARHPAAITPRHYVICRTAPADPADPAAWPAPLAAGPGRT